MSLGSSAKAAEALMRKAAMAAATTYNRVCSVANKVTRALTHIDIFGLDYAVVLVQEPADRLVIGSSKNN